MANVNFTVESNGYNIQEVDKYIDMIQKLLVNNNVY